MTWNYTHRPLENDRDKVRFLIGDTDPEDKQLGDEEIAYALSSYPLINLAAAFCCRALAGKYSKKVSSTVGAISRSSSDLARAYAARALELDPTGTSSAGGILALPSFGGRSRSEKEFLSEDTNSVPPFFSRGQFELPSGEE